MKKFLAYLMVIVITVSLGFAVFYLVRDNEKISLTTTTLYKDKGSTFELALDMTKNNSYTKISVSSSNENIVSISNKEIDVKKGVAKATLVANEGGIVRVNFQTNNSKFRNLYCDITIGDGSKENPYHIESAEQFALIGQDEKYTSNSCYEIVSDINLSLVSDKWLPIGSEANPFTGSISGNGHTIYNGTISSVGKNIGVFANIGAGAKIDNLQFKNITVESTTTTETMGVVAGVNNGSLTRIEVSDCVIANKNTNTYVGGIVGQNISTFGTAPNTASIVRASVNAKFVGDLEESESNAISGKIGGITGYNNGGTIAYTYTKSPEKVVLAQGCDVFGGIVGQNTFLKNPGNLSQYSKNLKGFVRDSYTILNVDSNSTKFSAYIGAVIGHNTNQDSDTQQIYGCYYPTEYFDSGIKGVGNGNSDSNAVTNATIADMKSLSNYVSHIEKVPYYDNESGNIKYSDGDTVLWNKNIWSIQNDTNQGFPILNMSAMDVTTDIVSGTFTIVNNISDLWASLNGNLDGQYYVSNVDASGVEWLPIGTESKPFTGYVLAKCEDSESYATISDLTIKTVTDEKSGTVYSGLFGCLGTSGTIENIKLQNVTLQNEEADCVGALVALNNGSIKNCLVSDGNICGKTIVGGVVGQNNGSITTASVAGNLTIVAKSETGENIGGIVGQNHGSVNSVDVRGNVVLRSNTSSDKSSELYIGGIAGINHGNIKDAQVVLNQSTSFDLSKSGTTYAGGIAGYASGSIEKVSAEANIVASKNHDTYVGGIVGIFNAKQNNDISTRIKLANVKGSSLTGKYVGGVVSYLNTQYAQEYNISDKWIRNLTSEQYLVSSNVYNSSLMYAVHAAAVQDDVTLDGEYTGGIAYNIVKGVVLDAYSQANLKGKNNAGIVYYINFDGNSCTGGLMTRIYAVVKFEGGSTNYSVTASNVHSDGMKLSKRTAGFIDDYYYTVAKDKGSKDPTYSGDFLIGVGNIFTDDSNRITKRDRKESTMKGTELWTSFTADNNVTGSSVWITGNGFPTIKGL